MLDLQAVFGLRQARNTAPYSRRRARKQLHEIEAISFFLAEVLLHEIDQCAVGRRVAELFMKLSEQMQYFPVGFGERNSLDRSESVSDVSAPGIRAGKKAFVIA